LIIGKYDHKIGWAALRFRFGRGSASSHRCRQISDNEKPVPHRSPRKMPVF
jgi:hypothetical protein